MLYIYWAKGATSFSTTTSLATAMATDNVCLATYEGGTKLDADYGRTIVDGGSIKTGTVTAAQLVKTGRGLAAPGPWRGRRPGWQECRTPSANSLSKQTTNVHGGGGGI